MNEDTGEKGYEVKSIVSEKELVARGQMLKRQSSYNQQINNDKNSEGKQVFFCMKECPAATHHLPPLPPKESGPDALLE